MVAQERKAALLSKLLRRDAMQSVLVFVRRKVDADRLARAVRRGGVEATSIHADRTQEQRIEALEDFRTGHCPVLIATDVAARGLDVDGISHVINFDVPRSPEDYIHRSGRTARAGAARRGVHLRVGRRTSRPRRDRSGPRGAHSAPQRARLRRRQPDSQRAARPRPARPPRRSLGGTRARPPQSAGGTDRQRRRKERRAASPRQAASPPSRSRRVLSEAPRRRESSVLGAGARPTPARPDPRRAAIRVPSAWRRRSGGRR